MAVKRIIPCLDIRDGRVVKGTKFLDVKDVASPVELGKKYSDSGADELAFYDITASTEGRKVFTDLLRQVAACISVPLTVGGGISEIGDLETVFECGAAKASINSGALSNPSLIEEAARKYGSGRVVVSADVKRAADGVFHVFRKGGMEDTGIVMTEWVKRCEQLGAGEFVINSIDADGMRGGFDIPLLRAVCGAVSVPVIASGGAGSINDFVELFKTLPEIDAGLGASVFHFGIIRIPELKQALRDNGIEVK